MASETTNLQLKKPAATDFYSIDDFNTNWDKIDAALGTVQVKHLTDVDCHDLDTPGDYIITMSTPTGENSAAHHFPAEDGGWALTILASAPAERGISG